MRHKATETYDPDGGFAQILQHSARFFPDKTAVIFEDRRISYGQLQERSARLASVIARRKNMEGKSVGVLMPNAPEFLEIVFACAMAGVPVSKINWRLSPREILHLVECNEVDYLFLSMEEERWKAELLEKLDIEVCDMDGGGYEALLARAAPHSDSTRMDANKELMRIHTSGTSGMPKCVSYSHGNMLRQIDACLAALEFDRDIVFQMMAQLFHTVSIGAYMTLAIGGTLVIFDRFDPHGFMDSIQKNNVTRISAIPTVVCSLMNYPHFDKYDLRSLKAINYSTAPMPPALLAQLMEKVDCAYYQSYGMTEMGSVVTVLGREDHVIGEKRLHSVGRPIEGAAVKIIDDDGHPCPANKTGEILLQGPGEMRGYHNMPEATESALRGGWYHSGDVGYLDEDGYLYLRGRKNDMIISGGENIYPREIENVIMEMIDDVRECAVFGLPDEFWGEKVCACVVLREGSRSCGEDILAFCASRLAKFKVPKQIYIVASLPKNAMGKVVKKALQEQYICS